jgi:putative ABC transport system permease protein
VRGGPITSTVAGALARRRVQTVMIGVVLLISTFASVLAVALIVDSNSPFDKAFAAQRGAQLTVAVNASRATPGDLAATTRLPEVTAAAGPYPEAAITATVRAQGGLIATQDSLILVGRDSPGGALDDLKLTSGHWPTSDSQIVLSSVVLGGTANGGTASATATGSPAGETITVTSAPGAPRLTVVGFADSVTQSADGWVLPGEMGKVTSPGAPAGAQMFYRFTNGTSAGALASDGAALRRALPRHSVVATQSYLVVQSQESERISLFVPFVVAFGVIGLVLSVLIVANVISGAVVSDYTRIGVLKSIGFTPGQVVATYVAQAMVPGAAGAVLGAGLGDLLAERLILRRTASAYSVGVLGVPAWIVVGIPLALWLLTGIVALLPALRGGRLGAIEAIAAGRAPRADHGYAAHRLAARLALPRPLTLGLTAAFARPARTAMTLIAVLLGASAVTFAYGLTDSLDQVANALRLENTVQVNVYPPVSPDDFSDGFTAGQQQAVDQAAGRLPGTQHVIAETDVQVKLAGLTTPVAVTAYGGDVGWMQYQMVSGHWYSGPGQVVVPLGFLKLTGAAVGDTVTITLNGRTLPVKIVGQVFADENRGMYMVTDASTLAGAGGPPNVYDIGLRPGTSASAYAQALSNALPSSYEVSLNSGSSSLIIAMTSLIAFLTIMLATAAGLGVLNTVVVQTRERAHDLGIFKAVGMTPRQTIAMVVSWTAGIGLVAGVIGVPVGLTLHRYVLPSMAAAANLGTPARFIDVYGITAIVILGLAGLIIAVAGALGPASWAAGSRTATALRAE